jgi:hypothetical protein
MLNLETLRVSNSRDVTWLNQVYGVWKGLCKPTKTETISILEVEPQAHEDQEEKTPPSPQEESSPIVSDDEGEDDEDPHAEDEGPPPLVERERTNLDDDDEEDELEQPTAVEPAGGKALRELAKLQASFNPDASTLADRIKEGSSQEKAVPAFTMIDRFHGDTATYTEGAFTAHTPLDKIDPSKYKDMLEVPTSFHEAWNHPDPSQQKLWREAINKEFDKMRDKKVWRKIKRKDMEPGRRCVKHKWVLDIKRSGTFRARLVACGYSQVPGVDFEQVYSAVANDVTFRLVIIVMIVLKLDAMIFDVETAFLYGKLDKKIYMDCPAGMDHDADECLILDRTLYGLVQSSRVYYQTYSKVIESFGFKKCPADPCLFMRKDEDGLCIILCYVDDNLVVGHRRSIDKLMRQLDDSFLSYTKEENLVDYLSCEIQLNDDRTQAWLGQPHMVKKIVKTFGDEVKGLPVYTTPGTPSFGILKPQEGEEIQDQDIQHRYRSGVGMLMYLIKHSRPDIANAVRELTKVLGKATPAAYKEMLRCIKFVLDTRDRGLKVEPSKEGWKLELYSDSDWAGDKNDRRSVSSFILFLNGVPIEWRSRSQKVTALSSAEAEFYACGEAVKEIPFVAQILLFLELYIETPVQVWIDNVGAIFMSENQTSSQRTRHMDCRWWFVSGLLDQGLIKIDFVKTKDNVSDIGTKNVNKETYDSFIDRLLLSRSEEGC